MHVEQLTAVRSIRCCLRCAVDNTHCLAIACAEPVNSTRDYPHKPACEERPTVATVASDRRLAYETSNNASGHGSDEVTTEGTQVSPDPPTLLPGSDFGEFLSRAGFHDVLKIRDLPICHVHAGGCQLQVVQEKGFPLRCPLEVFPMLQRDLAQPAHR